MRNVVKLLNIAQVALIVSGVGCAHSVHQYAASDYEIPKGEGPGRVVTADAEQFVVLSFAFNTDYADQAYQRLLANCPNGELVGVNARHSTSMSFLSYTNKMHLEAVCLNESSPSPQKVVSSLLWRFH